MNNLNQCNDTALSAMPYGLIILYTHFLSIFCLDHEYSWMQCKATTVRLAHTHWVQTATLLYHWTHHKTCLSVSLSPSDLPEFKWQLSACLVNGHVGLHWTTGKWKTACVDCWLEVSQTEAELQDINTIHLPVPLQPLTHWSQNRDHLSKVSSKVLTQVEKAFYFFVLFSPHPARPKL